MSEALMSLAGKRVVVIGGTAGIGFATAVLARGIGADVVIASSNTANVDAAVARLDGVTGSAIDLRNESSIARFFDTLGTFDHLAITAGDWHIPIFAPTRDIDLAAARNSFTVRFWGALAAVQHACRVIVPTGSITLTSGMLAYRPIKGAPMATAISGAIVHLVRGLAVDLAPLRINAVCPGITLTEQVRQMMPPERLQASVAPLLLPRGATPAEAATAYVYLMLNGYATGQALAVDGGGSVA